MINYPLLRSISYILIVDLPEFKKTLDSWCSEDGVSYKFVQYQLENHSSGISPDDKWWRSFYSSLSKLNLQLDTQIFPAATDSRFIRNKVFLNNRDRICRKQLR